MQSILQRAFAADTSDSYSQDKLGNTGSAAHSGSPHNTFSHSIFVASYARSTTLMRREHFVDMWV